LSFKRKNSIKTLALEAETAISLLPTQEQDHIRFQVAHNIKQLYKQYDSTEQYNSNHAKNEYKTINKIKEKLESNNALALKADKGNSVVIVYADNYHNKVQEFITNNSFTVVDKDPTKRFQNKIRTTIRVGQNTIHKDKRAKYVNLNPTAPTIRDLPKVHKENCHIRPIIDWQNAPAYKLAKLLNKLVQSQIPLPYAYNVKNTVHLMNDLIGIPYKQELKLVSFDIENMYSNIPTDELVKIINELCIEQALDEKTTNKLIKITHTIIDKNYSEFQSRYYIQNKGLAMGAPTSATLSEIYLQNLECTKIIQILTDNILGYFRYVDDILIVYDDFTDIHKVYKTFNSLAPTIKFTMETENDNKINFLDITIHKERNSFSFNIFRKPTATDIIIPKDSCNPPEHKHAAIRYLLNRMDTYYLKDDSKKTELNTIKHILTNNRYETPILKQFNKSTTKANPNNNKTTWAKFTYIGRQTKFISKLFKETPVRISYTTDNSIKKHLSKNQTVLKPQTNMKEAEFTS
jgi:hypothetical protein